MERDTAEMMIAILKGSHARCIRWWTLELLFQVSGADSWDLNLTMLPRQLGWHTSTLLKENSKREHTVSK